MYGLLNLIFIASLVAFVVFWWKKRKARLAAGETYASDATYQKISGKKRWIGIVCVASFAISVVLNDLSDGAEMIDGIKNLFNLIFFVAFIAFIYYWRKKASARKVAGENYQSDGNYLRISKIKRIIGGVCIVSLILSMAIPNSPAEEQHQAMLKELAKQRQQDEQKDLDEVRAIFENAHGQSVNLGNLGGKTETRLDKIYFKGKKIYVEAITVLSSDKKGGYRSDDMRDIYVYEKKGGSWVETAVNP